VVGTTRGSGEAFANVIKPSSKITPWAQVVKEQSKRRNSYSDLRRTRSRTQWGACPEGISGTNGV